MEYTPDYWVVLNMNTDTPHQRVLAGWVGSYTWGSSWKMNSGISKVVEHDDRYDFHGESGSIYTCYKKRYGMSGLMMDIFARVEEEFKPQGFTVSIDESYSYTSGTN